MRCSVERRNELLSAIRVPRWQTICLLIGVAEICAVFATSYLTNVVVNQLSSGSEIKPLTISLVCFSLAFLLAAKLTLPLCYRSMGVRVERLANVFLTRRMLDNGSDLFLVRSKGEIQRMVEQVGPRIAVFYSRFWINLALNIAVLISFVGLIFYYSWILAIVSIVVLVALFVSTKIVSKKVAERSPKYEQGSGLSSGALLELIEEHNTISSIKAEDFFMKRYEAQYNANVLKTAWDFHKFEALYTAFFGILITVFPLIVLFVGLLLKNPTAISMGAIISVYSLSGQLQEPVRQLAQAPSDYRINQENVSLLDPLISGQRKSEPRLSYLTSIHVKSEGIKYGARTILKGFEYSFSFPKTYVLHGETGAGKSTLLKAISGETALRNCAVFFNGFSGVQYDLAGDILLCSQEPVVFHGTFIDNISCGESFSSEDLSEVYEACQLRKFVCQYSEYKEIAINGSNISGGEKQRISLARMLIRKPMLLLLDEVTSGLDTETAAKVAKKVVDYCKQNQIMLIAVSHKREFDSHVDEVVEVG